MSRCGNVKDPCNSATLPCDCVSPGGAGFPHLTADLILMPSYSIGQCVFTYLMLFFAFKCSPLWSPTLSWWCCLHSSLSTPVRRMSSASLLEEDHDQEPVLLPPPDYSDDAPPSPVIASTPTPKNMVSTGSASYRWTWSWSWSWSRPTWFSHLTSTQDGCRVCDVNPNPTVGSGIYGAFHSDHMTSLCLSQSVQV